MLPSPATGHSDNAVSRPAASSPVTQEGAGGPGQPRRPLPWWGALRFATLSTSRWLSPPLATLPTGCPDRRGHRERGMAGQVRCPLHCGPITSHSLSQVLIRWALSKWQPRNCRPISAIGSSSAADMTAMKTSIHISA